MIGLLSPADRDVGLGIVARALINDVIQTAPISLPLHRWLCDHGLSPGVFCHDDGSTDALWTVWDPRTAMATVGAVPLRRVFA